MQRPQMWQRASAGLRLLPVCGSSYVPTRKAADPPITMAGLRLYLPSFAPWAGARRERKREEKDAGAPYQMVRGGASIRRSTDPAIRHWPDLVTDGLTDDRIRRSGDDSYGKGADPARRDGPGYLLFPLREQAKQVYSWCGF
jgi:hypothetical protein